MNAVIEARTGRVRRAGPDIKAHRVYCGEIHCRGHLGDYEPFPGSDIPFVPIAGMVLADGIWRLSEYALKRIKLGKTPKYAHGWREHGDGQYTVHLEDYPVLIACYLCPGVNIVRRHVDTGCALCDYLRQNNIKPY